ncbi:DNA/RNA non-specific endonuclease [Tuwongella immobilis]|uniref:DNA/RNA non-specific endonuclease n=1 Tax=Tuwongella immobilis TaxID=692036 RepID=UPI0013A6D50D|nr:DNA/RNA non-specific endonuclease [Tuwongella immobilis]
MMPVVSNCRVSEWHTYFVGCEEWGWAVWAHHADCILDFPVDSLGRANEVNAYLDKSVLRAGTPATYTPPGYDSSVGHAKGHLLANVLGGLGSKLCGVNQLFHKTTNNSMMKKVENAVKRLLTAGDTVHYNVRVLYENFELVPYMLKMCFLRRNPTRVTP